MTKRRKITEETKQKIAELSYSTDLSFRDIAKNLGVAVGSVHKYKDYGGEKDLNLSFEEPSSPYVEAKKEPVYNFEKHHWEPEIIDSTGDPINDHVETEESIDSDAEPKGISFVGGHPFQAKEPKAEPDAPEIDWKAINEKKKRDDTLTTVALVGGGLAGLGILGYLAHRSQSNNQNFSQPSWNNQGTPLLDRLFNNNQNQW